MSRSASQKEDVASSASGGGFRIGGREESDDGLSSCEDVSIPIRRAGDDISPAPRRRKLMLRSVLQKEDAAAEALQFQPLTVDDTKCLALMWNRGRGRQQCCFCSAVWEQVV